VLKNKHQAVSQGGYGLEARRLERLEAKKGINGFASSFPAFYLRTYNAFTKSQTTPNHGLRRRFSISC
jgi:hypothetical protein